MSNIHFEPGLIHSPNHELQVIGNTGKRTDVVIWKNVTDCCDDRADPPPMIEMKKKNKKKNRYDTTGAQTIDNFHYQLIYPDAQGDNSPKHNDIQHFLTYKAAKSHMREAESRPCSMF